MEVKKRILESLKKWEYLSYWPQRYGFENGTSVSVNIKGAKGSISVYKIWIDGLTCRADVGGRCVWISGLDSDDIDFVYGSGDDLGDVAENVDLVMSAVSESCMCPGLSLLTYEIGLGWQIRAVSGMYKSRYCLDCGNDVPRVYTGEARNRFGKIAEYEVI